MRSKALTKAIKAAGSIAKLARMIGIRPQAISQWDTVPYNRVIAIERFTGVSCHELRPDLYPMPHLQVRAASTLAANE
jgi:DNA-binding transcriptional regulator YdaS (Cro superfamily)